MGRNLMSEGLQNYTKGRGVPPSFLSRCAAHPNPSLPPQKPQAWCHCYLFFLTTLPIIMFLKVIFTFLAVGALSVSALTIPVARSPAPEPDCEFPRWSLTAPCHDLTSGIFNQSKMSWPGMSLRPENSRPDSLDPILKEKGKPPTSTATGGRIKFKH